MVHPPKRIPGRNDLFYLFVRCIGYIAFQALYRISVEGRHNIPTAGPGVILSKHQFWTDIPIVGLAAWRPLHYIAKQELFAYPLIRHLISSLGGIPINRANPVKSLDSFRYVEMLLQKGECIVLFPEGTYYPHSMGKGKHGFMDRILHFQEKMGWDGSQGIPFIPMGIRYGKAKLRPDIVVKTGPPVYASEGIQGKELTDRIMAEIASLSGLKQ